MLNVSGIGENAAGLIKFAQMFSRVYLRASCFTDGVLSFTDTNALRKYYESVFLGACDEQVRAMLFDDELNMMKEQLLIEGTVSNVELSIRKLTDFVIKNNCGRVVIAHNHPNGIMFPSNEDISATKELCETLNKIDIELLDVDYTDQEQWSDLITFHCKMSRELADHIVYAYEDEIRSVLN